MHPFGIMASGRKQVDNQQVDSMSQRVIHFVKKFLNMFAAILVGGRNHFQQGDKAMTADMPNGERFASRFGSCGKGHLASDFGGGFRDRQPSPRRWVQGTTRRR